MHDAHDAWFASEILPLEGALTRYLRRVWREAAEVEDLRQEVYVRVYESARTRRPPAAAPFLFAVARNLLIDKMRQARVVSIDLMADLESLGVAADEVHADRVLSGRQELARLHRAVLALPARCREVFRLRKIEGLSQRDTAQRLGIAEGTVEKQIAKAMRLLAGRFLGEQDADECEVDGKRSGNRDDIGTASRS